MRIVHASDLHLGRPLRGVPIHDYLDVDAFRHAAFRALRRLVDLCIEARAAFLLIAGDLIEGSVRNYKVGLRLVHELGRLEGTGTRVVWVRGNHDAENRVISNLLLPSHVFEIGLSGVQTIKFDDCGVTIVGRSFTKRCCVDNLLAEYPPKVAGCRTIGLLHTSGDGAITGDTYAPCRRSELRATGYDYLALGHVHEPTMIARGVCYSGCLQGRSFLESGRRGCRIVSFSGAEALEQDHRALDAVRFGSIRVDVAQAKTLDDVVGCVMAAAKRAKATNPGRALMVRFLLVGDSGGELLLSTNPALRRRALHSVLREVGAEIAVDGFWLDIGTTETAPFPIAVTEAPRREID